MSVLNDPACYPLDTERRHRARVTHPEDHKDRSVLGKNISTVVDGDAGLGDHFVCDTREDETRAVLGNRNGVNDIVTMFGEYTEVMVHVMQENIKSAGNVLASAKSGNVR